MFFPHKLGFKKLTTTAANGSKHLSLDLFLHNFAVVHLAHGCVLSNGGWPWFERWGLNHGCTPIYGWFMMEKEWKTPIEMEWNFQRF
jgi:hypothetical protein